MRSVEAPLQRPTSRKGLLLGLWREQLCDIDDLRGDFVTAFTLQRLSESLSAITAVELAPLLWWRWLAMGFLAPLRAPANPIVVIAPVTPNNPPTGYALGERIFCGRGGIPAAHRFVIDFRRNWAI